MLQRGESYIFVLIIRSSTFSHCTIPIPLSFLCNHTLRCMHPNRYWHCKRVFLMPIKASFELNCIAFLQNCRGVHVRDARARAPPPDHRRQSPQSRPPSSPAKDRTTASAGPARRAPRRPLGTHGVGAIRGGLRAKCLGGKAPWHHTVDAKTSGEMAAWPKLRRASKHRTLGMWFWSSPFKVRAW